jgi:DNA-binding transcriptional LysR family regulator
MELRQLRYAVRLSSTLHFGRAAELEFITQPAFSQHIARLERELGAALFTRGPGGVHLTPAGSVFVQRAEEILRASADMESDVRRVALGHRDKLKIGVIPGSLHELVAVTLQSFRAAHPDVALEFVELAFDNQVAAILDGSADVAFLPLPLEDERVMCHALFAEPLCVGLPAGHPKADAPSLSVEDIVDLPFVTAADGAPGLWTTFWRCDEERGGPARAVATTSSVMQTLLTIAHYGAVDTGPRSSFRCSTYPGVVGVPLHDGRYACAVIAYRRSVSRAAIDALRDLALQVAREGRGAIPGAVSPEAAPPGTPMPLS